MRNIFKYMMVLIVLGLSSCDLTDLDLLENPNEVAPENAEISLFFNAIQLDFKDFVDEASDESMPLVRMTAMTGGNTYDNNDAPTTFNLMWNLAYSDLIPDIDQLIAIAESADDPASAIPTYSGAGKIMKAYILMTLVDFFGDIPFSEAGQGVAVPSPLADGQNSVYEAALGLIDAAIADFSKTGPNIGSVDLFYGGDNAKWLALANSVKLKYYLTTRLVNGDAGSQISSLAGSVIQEASGDFAFEYGTNRVNPNARHPLYNDGYENGAGLYLSNYFMWSLAEEKGMADPRLRYYFYRQDADPSLADAFTLDCNTIPRPLHYNGPYPWCTAGNYWGRDHGNNDGIPPDTDRRTVTGVYPAGGKFDGDNFAAVQNLGTDGGLGQGIQPIILSSYVQFMLAEAALTTSYAGDARAHLENGIRQSIAKVMSFGSRDGSADAALFATSDEVDAYVDLVLGNYDAADDNGKLDIVMKEYHIALWGNGIEAYNGYRRTGYPSNMQPTREVDSGTYPRSVFYPADYVNLNANASQKALADQIFWDNNPAGFID